MIFINYVFVKKYLYRDKNILIILINYINKVK